MSDEQIDLEQVRKLREKVRQAIGWREGCVITQEQLSTVVAMLGEVWTGRIWSSPEAHLPTGMKPEDLFKAVCDGITDKMREQAALYLPHAKTFTLFKKNDPPNHREAK